jgi:hypothetical protein
MERPVIEKIWLNDKCSMADRMEIRVDWSNDRHHAFTIRPPYGEKQVANALIILSGLISSDEHLKVE